MVDLVAILELYASALVTAAHRDTGFWRRLLAATCAKRVRGMCLCVAHSKLQSTELPAAEMTWPR